MCFNCVVPGEGSARPTFGFQKAVAKGCGWQQDFYWQAAREKIVESNRPGSRIQRAFVFLFRFISVMPVGIARHASIKIDTMIAAVILSVLGIYLACGLVFAIAFALFGAKKIDPHAAAGSWGFRLLIIPGAMAFWPLLMWRWCRGIHEPPAELNAHRQAARTSPEPVPAVTTQANTQAK